MIPISFRGEMVAQSGANAFSAKKKISRQEHSLVQDGGSRKRLGFAMRTNAILDEKNARHRRRIREAGDRQVLFELPAKTLAAIDELKKRQGLRSRSRALLQLIERGMQVAE